MKSDDKVAVKLDAGEVKENSGATLARRDEKEMCHNL